MACLQTPAVHVLAPHSNLGSVESKAFIQSTPFALTTLQTGQDKTAPHIFLVWACTQRLLVQSASFVQSWPKAFVVFVQTPEVQALCESQINPHVPQLAELVRTFASHPFEIKLSQFAQPVVQADSL